MSDTRTAKTLLADLSDLESVLAVTHHDAHGVSIVRRAAAALTALEPCALPVDQAAGFAFVRALQERFSDHYTLSDLQAAEPNGWIEDAEKIGEAFTVAIAFRAQCTGQPPRASEIAILRTCLGNLYVAVENLGRVPSVPRDADVQFAMREAAQALGPPYSGSTKCPEAQS